MSRASVRLLGSLGLLGLLLAAPTSARADEWVLLGQREVDKRAERDAITVTAAEGRFRRIKLEVRGRAIQLLDLKVHFGDGGVQDIAVRSTIEAGGETRAIDLKGGPRVIRRVELAYRTQGRRPGKGVVRLFGFGGKEADQGWVELGERTVNFVHDRDTVPVTAAEGRFTRLRFRVRDNGIAIKWIKVRLGSGEVLDLTYRVEVERDAFSRAIDLPGEARVIREVELAYDTEGRPRDGRATVTVFGFRAEGGPAADDEDEREWQLLGQRVVAFQADRDVIPVTASEGRFREVRLKVEGNGVEVLSLKVDFGNGGQQDVTVRRLIPEGGFTRAIELDNGPRVVRQVRLRYKTEGRPRDGRATVKVFGRP